jgi:hypothetical protein
MGFNQWCSPLPLFIMPIEIGRVFNQKPPHWVRGIKIGGAKRDRTADLNTASVALSQLS